MKVSFEGIGESVVTFYNSATAGAAAGEPVKMTDNGEVGACGSGDKFIGLALTAEGEYCAVQTKGYAQTVYSGTAPAVGYAKLSGNGSGGVKSDAANGREILVIDVDTVNKLVGIVL